VDQIWGLLKYRKKGCRDKQTQQSLAKHLSCRQGRGLNFVYYFIMVVVYKEITAPFSSLYNSIYVYNLQMAYISICRVEYT